MKISAVLKVQELSWDVCTEHCMYEKRVQIYNFFQGPYSCIVMWLQHTLSKGNCYLSRYANLKLIEGIILQL